MPIEDTTKSVFTDDSGARTRAVTWAIRSASGVLLVCVLAVGASIFGHVALPGLDAPLHLPGAGHADGVGGSDHPGGAATSGPDADRVATGGSDTTARTTPSTTAQPTTAPVPTPSKGKPTTRPTTAADPVHQPGTPPTEPPGKAKSSSTDG